MKFQEFKKIPRLNRDIIITEKIDGTNGVVAIFSFEDMVREYSKLYPDDVIAGVVQVFIDTYCLYIHPENPHGEENEKLYVFAGSRNRWLGIGKQKDNYKFACWVRENGLHLTLGLGKGRHYGEWWGNGIQRGYDIGERQFSLFNVSNVKIERYFLMSDLSSCHIVPTLYIGKFDTNKINQVLEDLRKHGSWATRFMKPEGICIYHTASGGYFKVTLDNDEKPKGQI